MRIAVFCFGHLGHVTPVVPLVHAAMAAGHEVRVLTDLDGMAIFGPRTERRRFGRIDSLQAGSGSRSSAD